MSQHLLTIIEIVNHLASKHPEILLAATNQSTRRFTEWESRRYEAPCPAEIKHSVLQRYNLPNSTWVETGTFMGDTTKFLSEIAAIVYSIEPEPALYSAAVSKFSSNQSVKLINDVSENAFKNLLPKLSGSVCFWLDGHYSGANTFAGPNDTPLVEELSDISRYLSSFESTVIAIDDIRLCGKMHVYGSYPSLDYLVDWARSNHLSWSVEFDIFVATNR